MALNDIIFIKGQGGLGRPLEGEDYISGLIFYAANANLPSGFSTTDRIKSVGSLGEAEGLGITNAYADVTAATGSYVVTSNGPNGDVVTINVAAINELGVPTTYTLGVYTKVSGDTTTALVATAIGAAINLNTVNNGFSASVTGSTITITAPKRFGTFLNAGTPISAVYSSGATLNGTITQFSGGTATRTNIWHYQIAEFFRQQPKGQLFIGFFEIPAIYTFAEIQTVQNFANGKIRQLGVYKDAANYAAADTTAIQAVCNTLAVEHKPLSVVYSGNLTSVTDLSTLPDLATFNNPNVSVVISQDFAGQGNYLYVTTGRSVPTLGATLGAVAFAKVSEDIAWVSKYNISSGFECDTVGFANGTKLINVSQSLLNTLDNRRYIFLIKYVGIAGSYFNDSHCSIAVTSDYAYIENNRTIDKGIRGIYSSMLPNLNSPLVLNADGTLTDVTIEYFISQASINLDQMVRDSELSAFQVTIDATQNVLSTSTLVISAKLVPIGVARNIVVNIGFTLSIQ
jgi:hypothetical protein